MEKTVLYLKTIFCCLACDGEIAKEEIEMVKRLGSEYEEFSKIEIEPYLNEWITAINENGAFFLNNYLKELSKTTLSQSEQLFIVDLAFKTIDADERIEYSEIKFFKKIRNRLSISDEEILKLHPEKEDFLLPDVNVADEFLWDSSVRFEEISLNLEL